MILVLTSAYNGSAEKFIFETKNIIANLCDKKSNKLNVN